MFKGRNTLRVVSGSEDERDGDTTAAAAPAPPGFHHIIDSIDDERVKVIRYPRGRILLLIPILRKSRAPSPYSQQFRSLKGSDTSGIFVAEGPDTLRLLAKLDSTVDESEGLRPKKSGAPSRLPFLIIVP